MKKPVNGKGRKHGTGARYRSFKPWRFSFVREAKWMTFGTLAPLGIGIILALVFWFTR